MSRLIRPAIATLFAVAATAFIPADAGAQGRGTIYPGRPVTGTLDANDVKRDGDRYHEDWDFTGRRGEVVTIVMDATFDAYLDLYQITGSTSTKLTFDDDGGDGLDALITYTLPADGSYWICATLPEDNAGTGTYALTLTSSFGGSVPLTSSSGGAWMTAGNTYSGSLSQSDSVWTDGTYFDTWRFSGQAGETITFRMRSPNFRSYIQLGRMVNGSFSYMSGSQGEFQGEQQIAVLSTTLATSGEYAIRANSHGTETGPYTVSFTSSRGGSSPAPTPVVSTSGALSGARVVMANENVTGDLSSSDPTLPDGSHYDLWRYAGPTGQRIRITLRSSDFDTYLAFGTMEGATFNSIATNDDGAGGTDAMIDITITRGGEFVIRANSLSAGRTGRYTLHVQTW